jgi:hypothetical protein
MHASHTRLAPHLLAALALFAAACGDDDTAPSTDAGPPDAVVFDLGPADAGAPLCEAATVRCVDDSIALLDLFDTVNAAEIREEGTTAGEFTTFVDATAGGMMPTTSFVYARFTDTGLVAAALSDEDALVSQDWDIALRRFVLRVNSGVSGPSCVQVALTASGTTFESLTAPPGDAAYRAEAYLTDACEIVADGNGLGSPATELSSFWEYPGCVAMTGNVYVLALRSGRHVKLQVVGYYSPANQASCDTSGMVSLPSGSGSVRLRWAFLD